MAMYELQPVSELIEPQEEGICSFCSLPVVSPTQHACGRLFCQECVYGMDYQCQSCQKNPGKLSFSSTTLPMNFLGEIEVHCPQCSKMCVFSELEEHKTPCDCVALVNCIGKPLGCSFSAPKKYLLAHEKECERAKLFPLLLPLTTKLAALEKENEELRQKTSSLQQENQTLQQENKALKRTRVEGKTEASKLTHKTKTLETQNHTLKTETTTLQNNNKLLQNNNKLLQTHIKTNPLGSGISSIFLPSLPEPTQPRKRVEVFSGPFKVGAHFRKSKGGRGVEFSMSFQRGEFEDKIKGSFPFKGRVILSLLSPDLLPFKTKVLDTTKNEVFERFGREFPSCSFVGCGEFAMMEVVRNYLDGEGKLWFSVKVERD